MSKETKLNDIKIELEKVGCIVSEAMEKGGMCQIERDIALESLRRVYDVLYLIPCDVVDAPKYKEAEYEAPIAPEKDVEFKSAEIETSKLVVETVLDKELDSEPESKSESPAEEGDSLEMPFRVQPPIRRDIIDSLYGDAPVAKVTIEETKQTVELIQVDLPFNESVEDTTEDVQQKLPDVIVESTETVRKEVDVRIPVQESLNLQTVGEPVVSKVLNEIIETKNTIVFNETIADNVKNHDVASMLSSQSVSELRKSIGLNDKFLLLHDLFGNDTALYDKTIDTLDSCPSLDDAYIYLQEHFVLDPNREGVQLLVSLLERKFS